MLAQGVVWRTLLLIHAPYMCVMAMVLALLLLLLLPPLGLPGPHSAATHAIAASGTVRPGNVRNRYASFRVSSAPVIKRLNPRVLFDRVASIHSVGPATLDPCLATVSHGDAA